MRLRVAQLEVDVCTVWKHGKRYVERVLRDWVVCHNGHTRQYSVIYEFQETELHIYHILIIFIFIALGFYSGWIESYAVVHNVVVLL